MAAILRYGLSDACQQNINSPTVIGISEKKLVTWSILVYKQTWNIAIISSSYVLGKANQSYSVKKDRPFLIQHPHGTSY